MATVPKLAGDLYALAHESEPGAAAILVKGANTLRDLLDILTAAVARVELANSEGNPILSAWLPDAKAALAAARGEG